MSSPGSSDVDSASGSASDTDSESSDSDSDRSDSDSESSDSDSESSVSIFAGDSACDNSDTDTVTATRIPAKAPQLLSPLPSATPSPLPSPVSPRTPVTMRSGQETAESLLARETAGLTSDQTESLTEDTGCMDGAVKTLDFDESLTVPDTYTFVTDSLA